jgi:hypothetical protein
MSQAKHAKKKRKMANDARIAEIRQARHNKDFWEAVATGVLMYYLRIRAEDKILRSNSLTAEYKIRAGFKRKGYVNRTIMWDAKCGFILYADNTAVACIGFQTIDSTIIVKQIQGSFGQSAHLRPFAWDAMLLDAVICAGREAGYKKIEVVSANENKYAVPSRTKRFMRRYDETAQNLGLSRVQGNRNFRLDIN